MLYTAVVAMATPAAAAAAAARIGDVLHDELL